MKVFISWSGDRSKAIAEELRDWLPTIVQSLEPFVSTQDVPPGGRGLNVLASQLQDCSFGILCLTQENKQEPWIHFEAGALSKVIDVSRVVPLLLDLKVSDLTGPLVQFQAIPIEERSGVFSLIRALADESSPPLTESRLQRLFDAFWPELETKVSLLKQVSGSKPRQEARSEREILEEILLLSRNTERQLSRGSLATSTITYDVILTDVGDKKIHVIKVIRDHTNIGLKEAKDLIDSAPSRLPTGMDREEAYAFLQALVGAGAQAEIH
jgi:ribosomal protein L7/L12